jgi:hypothetical protein
MIANVQTATFEDFLQEELAKLDASGEFVPEFPSPAIPLKTTRVLFQAAPAPELIPYEAFLRLGFHAEATVAEVEKRFRKLSKTHHPDHGGNAEIFHELAQARQRCVDYLKSR